MHFDLVRLKGSSLTFAISLLLLFPAFASGNVTVIRGATILTASQPPRIDSGVLIIENGKIQAFGQGFQIPEGAKIIEAQGKFLTPGIIDVHSHMGTSSWNHPHSDTNELTSPITPHARVIDAFNSEDRALRWAVAGGVTTVQVLPGSGNMIGGQSAVYKLKPGKVGYATLYEKAPPGMKMASGENPKRVYGDRKQTPSSRLGNFMVFRDAFRAAKAYQAKIQQWEKNPSGMRPERDLKMEPLVEILEGKRLVHIHCYRQDEMLNFIAISKEFGFKIRTFQHGIEAYKVATQLAREQIAVSTWGHFHGSKLELKDGIPYAPAILTEHGAMFTIHSDNFDTMTRLFHDAAQTIPYGVPEEIALKSLTSYGAWALGIDQHTGSIAVGKDADLALFNRHPFDGFALVEKTIIDGEVVFDRETNWSDWAQIPR